MYIHCPYCDSTKLYNVLYGLLVSEYVCLDCDKHFEYEHEISLDRKH